MTHLTLADVVEGLTGNRIEADQPVSTVVIDSREVTPGAVFVALPGENVDGHDFVAHAFQQGAIAAIVHQPAPGCAEAQHLQVGQASLPALVTPPVCIQVENSMAGLQRLARYWRQKFSPRVVGITGSVGKSTTKELVWSILSTRYNVLKNEGNFNNEIGLPLTLLQLNESHEYMVLEMAMYDMGEIATLCHLALPHIGVVTNVGPSHLERLGTVERIAQAKAELVQALPPGSFAPETETGEEGIAILNYDDPLVRPMMAQTRARVFTYGMSPDADLWASDVASAGLEGIRFVFHYGDEEIHARLPLLGRHSVHTALRAALVGLVAGLDWSEIIRGLQELPNTAQLRLVAVTGPNQSTLLDDTYNASPASTLAALNLLEDLTATRKVAVLGDMMELGSFEEEGHRKVGCRAADVVDQLIVIGSRARFIADEARACGLDPAMILEMDSNEAVISYLVHNLAPGDTILIKGSNSQKMDRIISALAAKGREQRDKTAGQNIVKPDK
jgi:UDP-N-acetylmuramoyl-tripeptide--D-alanyl-D-alanine ligase